MTMLNNKSRVNLILSALIVMSPPQLLAQFDTDYDNFPPPPNFDESTFNNDQNTPPAPPSNSFNSGSSGNSFSPGGLSRDKTAASAGLPKSKKDQLARAGIEDMTNENFGEFIDSFDYPNVEITDIVKAISELTGKNFIVDPGVRGKITILAPSRITVAEAYKAFLSALAINGYAVVPSGNFLKVRSARNAQRDGIETYSGAYYPNSDQMITRVIALKHISADAIKRDLKMLTSKDGEMDVYNATNSLIISDYGSNIDRIMKIINQLDVPGFEDQLEVIPIRFAKAKDIAELVSKIVNKGEANKNQSGGTFSSGVPRFTRSSSGDSRGQGSPYFMVIPDERSNSLVTVGNKAGIARIKTLLKQLDFQIKPDESGGVYVYYVKYGDAEKIAATLGIVAKESAPQKSSGNSGGSPLMISPMTGVQAGTGAIFGGDVKINADKNTNSLVILASKQDYDVILNLLGKIDIPRDQVYVESIIMEMKATDSMDWQVGYFKFGEGAGKVGFNGMQPDTLAGLLQPQGGSGAILGFGSSDQVTVIPPGTQTPQTISSLLGFINFLKANTNANILSTPQILAMDNQEAEIEVGDKVVTGQNSTISAQGMAQGNLLFEDATIKLKIKPFISPALNSVRLEINTQVQQLSTAKTPPGLVSIAQPLAKRSIKTNIVVPNKDTAVLGGLMKEDDIESVRKIPLLGDIPIIGWLFKSRSMSKEKTNMLVFLTPNIIRNESDSRNMLGKKLNERLDYIKSVGGRDPYGKKIDEISASRPEPSVSSAIAPAADQKEVSPENTPTSESKEDANSNQDEIMVDEEVVE